MNLTQYRVALFIVLWSLAVEEHFYLVWPFAVRSLSRKRLIALLSVVFIVEPALRAYATPYTSSFETIFMLTPFRLDSIAAGSLLALLTESVAASAWLKRWAVAGGITFLSLYGVLRFFRSNFIREENSIVFNSVGYSITAAACFFFVAWVLLNAGGRIGHRALVDSNRLHRSHQLWHVPSTSHCPDCDENGISRSLWLVRQPPDPSTSRAHSAPYHSFSRSQLSLLRNSPSQLGQSARCSPGSFRARENHLRAGLCLRGISDQSPTALSSTPPSATLPRTSA